MDSIMRSRVMSKIKSSGTGPEMALRKGLWHRGLRYRVQFGKERIDIAFPGKKVAVFVDGCFWHSCPIHGNMPKSNVDYWKQKLEKNIERGRAKDAKLQKEGWIVVHFWEHEVNYGAASCISQVEGILSDPEKEG